MATLNLAGFVGSASSVIGYSTSDGKFYPTTKNGEALVATQSGDILDFRVDTNGYATALEYEGRTGWNIYELGSHITSVRLGDGNDVVYATADATASEGIVIDTGNGDDRVDVTPGGDLTLNLGEGKDNAMIVSAAGDVKVNLGEGNDFVGIINAASDVVITSEGDVANGANISNVKGSLSLEFGGGADTVEATGLASGTINTGAGNDSIVLGDTITGTSIIGGEGKDSIDVTNLSGGKVTLTDFDISEDTLITKGTGAGNIAEYNSDGFISLKSGGAVEFAETNGYYLANTDEGGITAWASGSGSMIDLSSMTQTLTIIGNDNDDASDTMLGGSKADTIYAGAQDWVYGGSGADSIVLSGDSAVTYVGLATAGGKDVVKGFETVSDSQSGDKVYLFENMIYDGVTLSKDNNDLVVKQGKGTLTLKEVRDADGDSAAESEAVINIEDSSRTNYEVDFVSGTASVSDAYTMHNVYYADAANKGSNQLDFSKLDESLVADLGNTGLVSNTGNVSYYGEFSSVKGGKDDTVLIGAADYKETLTAGSGNTTLWGGGRKADVLDGGSGNASKDNVVKYYYMTGDGKDSIINGNWGASDENDVLWFGNVQLASINNDGTNTTFTMSTLGDKLTVSGIKADTAVKFTDDGDSIQLAKLGLSGKSNNWTYEEGVNMYLGGKSNTLTVSGDSDANIWLDGSASAYYENVTQVNASGSSGTVVIAGSYASESLVGGKGVNSLWGGAGSANDTLKGSTAGTTYYYFGRGEGNDVITNTSSDDKVMLYNVNAWDIVDINTSVSGQMKFTLSDGSTLTIKGMSSSSVNQFQLADGSNWTYNQSTKYWTLNS